MDPIIDDARKLGVLDEAHLIDILLLVGPHEQILVEILEIRSQGAF